MTNIQLICKDCKFLTTYNASPICKLFKIRLTGEAIICQGKMK